MQIAAARGRRAPGRRGRPRALGRPPLRRSGVRAARSVPSGRIAIDRLRRRLRRRARAHVRSRVAATTRSIVSVRVSPGSRARPATYDPLAAIAAQPAQVVERRRTSGPRTDRGDAACTRAAPLAGERRGPLLVDEYDSTIVVPPGCVRARSTAGNIEVSAWRTDARVDPITLEIVGNALASIADEMALVLMRSAYSTVVRDTMDYSTALCDRQGRLVAQGLTLAGPSRLDSRRDETLCERARRLGAPGDVFIMNDPFDGGSTCPTSTSSSRSRRRRARRLAARSRTTPTSAARARAATPARDRDLPGGPPHPAAQALRPRGESGRFQDDRGEHAEPAQVLGDLRAQVAACLAGERGSRSSPSGYGARRSAADRTR